MQEEHRDGPEEIDGLRWWWPFIVFACIFGYYAGSVVLNAFATEWVELFPNTWWQVPASKDFSPYWVVANLIGIFISLNRICDRFNRRARGLAKPKGRELRLPVMLSDGEIRRLTPAEHRALVEGGAA